MFAWIPSNGKKYYNILGYRYEDLKTTHFEFWTFEWTLSFNVRFCPFEESNLRKDRLEQREWKTIEMKFNQIRVSALKQSTNEDM